MFASVCVEVNKVARDIIWKSFSSIFRNTMPSLTRIGYFMDPCSALSELKQKRTMQNAGLFLSNSPVVIQNEIKLNFNSLTLFLSIFFVYHGVVKEKN